MRQVKQISKGREVKTFADQTSGEPSRIYLLPGEILLAAEPCQITTILGSCVAVCLWDFVQHCGGMNHFLLPVCHEEREVSMRFGSLAIPALLEGLLALGCKRAHMGAKLFGGAALFQKPDSHASSLGAKNVEIALQILKNTLIPVLSQDTGGDYGRKIVFNTEDGAVWSRRL